jgi:hypothetical protein
MLGQSYLGWGFRNGFGMHRASSVSHLRLAQFNFRIAGHPWLQKFVTPLWKAATLASLLGIMNTKHLYLEYGYRSEFPITTTSMFTLLRQKII